MALVSAVAASPALGQSPAHPRFGVTDPASAALNQGPKDEAVAEHGMVTTQLQSSTLAALEVLENGGNAVDAALTALFVQQVHDYHMVFLFGSMSALYYDAATDQVYALNAVGARPDAARLAARGVAGDPSKVAVGGTVRGAEALAERFGTRPWKELLQPAVEAAEEGAIVTSFMYGLNFALFEVGMLGDLRENDEARAFYMPEGHLVGVGQRWKMPALAETLRALAEHGADHMYSGAWGQRFVEEATERGHAVVIDDLADYQAEWRQPTRFSYGGVDFHGSPPPDTGGLEVGYFLNVLSNFDLAKSGHYSESPVTLEVMARVFDRGRRDMEGVIRDPLTWNLPERLWLDPEYGEMGAEYVRQTMPRFDLKPGSNDEADGATPSVTADLGSDHIVVVDRFGNWLSMLHTIHGGAPGVFVDGVRATGSELGGIPHGEGRRLALPITGLIATRLGKPWLAMGTPGYPPQPVTQVLVNILDFGMDPKAAAEAPRFWHHGGEQIQAETRIHADVRAALERRGWTFENLGDWNYHTGSMQIVWRDRQGRLHGVTDPRRLGYAKGH